jgi:DNA-binding response OmpR family regulator
MAETKTFLLVEDDQRDIELVEYEFKQAPIYVAGQDKYGDRAKHPLPDVILLDIKMPRMNGFDFLLWLRSQSPNQHRVIPVVLMSSSGLPEDVEHAYMLGANSYIIKPVNWHVFRERIKALGIYWVAQVETPKIHETGKEPWKRVD